MTARIDLFAPATITGFASGASSLFTEPPHGVFIQDPGSGTITLSIVATNTLASFSASHPGGGTVHASHNTIVITGLASQVNAALQTLEITEPSGAASDTIILSASESGELSSTTAIALNVASTIAQGFDNPPSSLSTLAAWTIDSLPGLLIGDPAAQALAAAGQGQSETLALTLSVVSGVLLLPNFSALSGIAATGIGSNDITLTFTADQLAAVNALLAQLSYAGPASNSGLFYALNNVSGPLGTAATQGNITFNVTGAVGPTSTIVAGADTMILGVESLALGTTITVTSITSDLGGISGSASLLILPDAAFEIPYNTLNLAGTSFDDGTLAADYLNENGTLIAPGQIDIGQLLNLGAGGLIDFQNTFNAGTLAQSQNQVVLSLAAGAVITGNGTLVAGNFSDSGKILGPGTILAAGGDTLVIAGQGIGGGANLDVAAGGVMALAPVNPLFGVFEPTPLTVGAAVTLAFLGQAGADDISGGLADSLDQRGGIIVIDSPDVILGTFVNFDPGDRLIFPGLTSATLLSITSDSFVVMGEDSYGETLSYTINAAYPSGTTPYLSTDDEGDPEIAIRDTQNDIFLGATLAAAGLILAQPGIAQPIQGLTALLASWSNQSLTLTLSVAGGVLEDGTLSPSARLTITAANPTALNAELASLAYTANSGVATDELFITAASGFLAGLNAAIPIAVTAATGTINGFGEAGEAATFTGALSTLITQPGAPGKIIVTGTADFADVLDVAGLGGAALVVDAGGTAIFDGAAAAALSGAVTIGNAAGAGFLSVFSDQFSVAGNITLAGNAAAAGSGALIAGDLALAGTLSAGLAAAATLYVPGALTAAAINIGAAGVASFSGAATAGLGAVNDAGTMLFADQATASATTATITGTLALEGTSALLDTGAANASGVVLIGPDATLSAASFDQTSGTLLLDGALAAAGVLAAGTITLAGGTIIAPNITLNGALSGAGDLEAATGLAQLTITGGDISATGAMDIGADIAMSGNARILIGPSAALELDHAVTGGTLSFAGPDAVLTIDDLQQFAVNIGKMQNSDVIDLVGIAPSLVTAASGTITIDDAQGNLIGGFILGALPSQSSVVIVSDGHGGALITRGGQLPCFVRGTRILTPTGYRPVETLDPGDSVITRGGAARPIRWIGHRTLDLGAETPDHPILFGPGSIAPGIPGRPVKLSPLHAVFLDDVLVPALHLVNGATIREQKAGPVTYFHLELDRHDIVLAEGMAVETFLENGNRGHLYEERGARAHCAIACAPLITGGPLLARIRRRLHAIALEAGYVLTYDAGLRGAAAQTALLPRITMRRRRRVARFTLPPGAATLALTARSATPADTNPDSEDRRQLGICLAAPPAGAVFGAGWLARGDGDAGHWMSGGADILLPAGARTAALEIAAVIRSWRKET